MRLWVFCFYKYKFKPMDNDKLNNIRHSCAHLLASAVLKLWPDTKITLGPPIENGFYYDFEFQNPISENDLPKIEKQMKKELQKWDSFEAMEVTADEALQRFKGNQYKEEMIEELREKGEKITLYTSGDFVDLCRGGHVTDPKKDLKHFKLLSVAGAYWRGDENNTMLTRIYGTAFDTKEALANYLEMLEEAKKRDHRKLGKELDLFTFSDLVGSGLPLFTPKGTLLRDLIVEKIQNIQKEFGYSRVTIPHITKKDLYETSGHWSKFGDELFKVKGQSDVEFVMKPMNCPHHTQIYASKPRSYKDLPLRYMESTMVYRDEQAGELLGLSRVRSITQDDAHVFCTPEQIKGEIGIIVEVIKQFYSSLSMWNEDAFWVSLSVRDPQTPEKYLGDAQRWDEAESILEQVAKEQRLPYKRVPGEAAFYGPKLDFMFKDAIGREWQLATAQLDFVMPERFGLEYTNEKGEKARTVMIHRAVAGSLERFLSVIIEHFAGAFPLWLAPTQAHIIPVGEKHHEYAHNLAKELYEHSIRVEVDDTNETVGKKIRNASTQKVPYILVMGDKEIEHGTVMVRKRGQDEQTEMGAGELIDVLTQEIDG